MTHPPKYVLGFAFDESLKHVVLLQKVKPAWAAGMWNGLGGKIEGTDASPHDAMEREFKEECGVLVPAENWQHLGAFERPEWYVECFCTRTDDIFAACTVEKEKITIYPVAQFLANTVLEPDTHSGLECAWLVPYARRFLLKPEARNQFTSSLIESLSEPEIGPSSGGRKSPRP